jgi:hypothetical protein
MTVMDRTMRYLAIITKVNMDSRPKIIDTKTGKFYPISTFEDLKETLHLMGMASSMLRPYVAHWYNTVFLPAFKELPDQPNKVTKEIIAETAKNKKTLYALDWYKNRKQIKKSTKKLVVEEYYTAKEPVAEQLA